VFVFIEGAQRHLVLEVNMTRFRNFVAVAVLTAGMLFGITTASSAHDWDHDDWRGPYQAERYPEYWRDRDGRCYRRVWDPYRGWIVVRFYPEPPAWERHDRGRHRGWYKHEERGEWRDRDDD
jgi:hypothetical protein